MSIHEEINELENLVSNEDDLTRKAELIVSIYRKYKSINSTEGSKYIVPLEKIAEKLNSNEYKGWVNYFKGDYNWLTANYNEAKIYFNEAIKFFKAISNIQRVAYSLNYLGIISEQQGNYFEALENYNKAKAFFENCIDETGIAMCFNNIGILQKYQGNYSEALKNYYESLRIHEKLGNKSNAGLALINIGVINNYQKNYKEEIKNTQAALKLFKEINDKKGIALALNNIGSGHISINEYDEALKVLEESIKVSKEINSDNTLLLAISQIGIVYKSQAEYEKAIDIYIQALLIAEKVDYKSEIAGINDLIGECYLKLNNFKKAKEYLQNGLKIADEAGMKYILCNILKNLYHLKKAEKNSEEALAYYEQHVELSKELENEETTKKIASMQFGYQIEKKEQEVVLEREKKEEIQKAYDLLDIEKQRSESLLLNILPAEVAHELKEKGSAEAKLFDDVTVLFTDFKGFTTLSEKMTPQELVNEIHECFKGFDEIIGKYGIEKIKTVGDAYLAVSGLPMANEKHAHDVVNAAIEIRDFMLKRKEQLKEKTFEIRIGINSGEVVAGIVGVKKYAYDIWGDTVNTAARMEQNSDAGKINISGTTYELVKDSFYCEYRGKIEAKNKGEIDMYYVESDIN